MIILKPKGTAAWLVFNTKLTDKQISSYCQISIRDIKDIRNKHIQIFPNNPIYNDQITVDEIQKCENDSNLIPTMPESTKNLIESIKKKKQSPYISQIYRGEKKSLIAWILFYYPNVSHKVIKRLLKTTSKQIDIIKNNPQDFINQSINPLKMGLFKIEDLQ